jgi:hypothetical protein
MSAAPKGSVRSAQPPLRPLHTRLDPGTRLATILRFVSTLPCTGGTLDPRFSGSARALPFLVDRFAGLSFR